MAKAAVKVHQAFAGEIVSLRKQNYGSSHCETRVAKCKIIKGKMLFPFSPLEKVPHIVLIFLFQCLQTYSLSVVKRRTWHRTSTGEITIFYLHIFFNFVLIGTVLYGLYLSTGNVYVNLSPRYLHFSWLFLVNVSIWKKWVGTPMTERASKQPKVLAGDVSPKELGATQLFSTPDTVSSSHVGLKWHLL